MPRWMLTLAVMIATLVPHVNVAAAQEAADAGPRERTDVHYFMPYRLGELDPSLTVISEQTGARCEPLSRSAPHRPDARRCFTQNQIWDPCFEGPPAAVGEPSVLACVTTPFDTDVVLLTTDGELPPPTPDRDFSGDDPWPWVLELANGDRCGIAIGAMPLLAGKRVNYTCEQDGWVIGDINRSQPVWVVNYLPASSRATELIEVTARWY